MFLLDILKHPKILGYAGIIIPVIVQAALLHPYYQKDEAAIKTRRFLLPIIVLMAFATANARKWKPLSESKLANFCFVSLVTFHTICLGIQNGLYDGPVLKDGLKSLEKNQIICKEDEGALGSPINSKGNLSPSEEGKKESKREESNQEKIKDKECINAEKEIAKETQPQALGFDKRPSIGELVRFSTWLVFSPRGLECSWAPSKSVIAPRAPVSNAVFFRQELLRAIGFNIYGNFCWQLLVYSFTHQKGFYGVLTKHTGIPESAITEFVTSYGMSFCLGASMWSAMEIAACGMNAFEFLFYPLARATLPKNWAPEKPFDPQRYPLLFCKPWQRASVSDFWGRGWHSLFRRDLVFCGALPVAKCASALGFGKQVQKILGLMGAMFLTAVMHEYAIASVSDEKHGIGIISFFINCALVMLLENLLQTYTKIRFQGNLGRMWTYGWLLYLGKPALDLWLSFNF
ncbi:hypothetical protein BY996DRAFT_4576736 [Phakopsora pachyrhizi]|nr:hypothetical protein BY996DRAFT_4576736 [Phakopsora pachyrhizi]